MLYHLEDLNIELKGNNYIAPGARLIGEVALMPEASVWFNAIIRADNHKIEIGSASNIQDGAVLHTDEGIFLELGSQVTVGHNAVLHGCSILDKSLVGIGAIVLNNAQIGRNCLIAANTLIPEGKSIPDNSLVMGSPGKVVREVTPEEIQRIEESARHYAKKAQLYAKKLKPC